MSTANEHAGKVIITCAITGAIHTPSMSPHLPVTPDEIVAESLAAAEAGAAILHLHARNPEDGRPDQSPEGFAPFLPRVKQGTDAVVNITTGGSPYMSVAERAAPSVVVKLGNLAGDKGHDILQDVVGVLIWHILSLEPPSDDPLVQAGELIPGERIAARSHPFQQTDGRVLVHGPPSTARKPYSARICGGIQTPRGGLSKT